jgi:exo-beta-1,3-glucanase (GH17 family)
MRRAAVYGVSIEASSGSQNLVNLSCVSLRIAAPLKIRVLSTVRRRSLFQVAESGWPSAEVAHEVASTLESQRIESERIWKALEDSARGT